MKVVISARYGGFGLSHEGMMSYAKHKGITPGEGFSIYDILRNDPALIAVVEELGTRANTKYSDLKVVEIPDDVKWHIEEYDGWEHVAEDHRTWGEDT